MEQLKVISPEEEMLGNIYIAKIKKIMPGLQAAFAEINKGITCYLSLKGIAGKIKTGDEILVQIKSEAIKTKLPTATTELSLPGQYCVVTRREKKVVYSNKISSHIKKWMKTQGVLEQIGEYETIIRTNAGELKDLHPLAEEIKELQSNMSQLIQSAEYRTCYSCLWKDKYSEIRSVKDIPAHDYDEIVTDDLSIYEILGDYFGGCAQNIRYYQDNYPLVKLYSVETHIKKALSKKVWLDNGGFLYIEPTEALTVIDVNTGKDDNKNQSSFLKVNIEAATEIARQIRVRNLSGIIIIDFISMKSQNDNESLLSYLSGLLEGDSITTNLVDMTPLGLVEITRKKTSRSIQEMRDFSNEWL